MLQDKPRDTAMWQPLHFNDKIVAPSLCCWPKCQVVSVKWSYEYFSKCNESITTASSWLCSVLQEFPEFVSGICCSRHGSRMTSLELLTQAYQEDLMPHLFCLLVYCVVLAKSLFSFDSFGILQGYKFTAQCPFIRKRWDLVQLTWKPYSSCPNDTELHWIRICWAGNRSHLRCDDVFYGVYGVNGVNGVNGIDGVVDGSMLPVDCWHQKLAQTFMFSVILVRENLFANNGQQPKWFHGGPQDPHITCHFTYVIPF